MRSRLIRTLVAVAMALLVPLHGMAAVDVGLCMELGHHGEPAAAADHGSTDDHGSSHGNESAGGGAHCSPCVACCAAAAISSFRPVLMPEHSALSVIGAVPLSFSGIPPETLDRPPLR
jgi:hypothetical protein